MTKPAGTPSLPLGIITDRYTRAARLYPFLLLLAPAVACTLALTSLDHSLFKSLAATFVTGGGVYLLSQLARDRGKQLQESLYLEWGGMPSVTILRHRDRRIDRLTKVRLHKNLSSLVDGTMAPTAAEETADQQSADEHYQAWSSYLRIHTRDHKRFDRIFDELVSFGYRRNLLGLRPFGIGISTLCLLMAASVSWVQPHHRLNAHSASALACAVAFLLFWVFIVTRSWVRLPADAYAERLAEATDLLYQDKNASSEASTDRH